MKKIDNLKIVEKYKFFGPIAIAIILIGVILMMTVKMNVGIDFAGGAIVKVDLGEYVALHDDIKGEVKDLVIEDVVGRGFTVSSERWSGDDNTTLELGLSFVLDGKDIDGNDSAVQAQFRERIEGSEENSFNNSLENELLASLTAYNAEIDDITVNFNFVGASSQKLLKNAIWATIVAILVMLIYTMIRFTVALGLSAIVCLAHDVLVMFTLTTIFQIQVNTTFIAAIITIVGYSINATIVIFDRIRELRKAPSLEALSDTEIANKAIKDTLVRTILTTLTTLVTILALAIVCVIMGVSTMEEFALPIIFGLLAGSYSSVLLASPTWVYLKKLGAKIQSTKKAK